MGRIGIKSGLVRASGSTPPPDPGTGQLLENFNGTIRYNSEGGMLFDAFTSEDDGSSAAIVSNSLRLYGSPDPGCSIYMHFFPITSSFYPFPEGYAQYYLRSGTWDPANNRLSFLVRCDTAQSWDSNGSDNIQFGTYVKNHADPNDMEQGRHFYHLFDINMYANKWMKCWVNAHPQHEREHTGEEPGNEPTMPTVGYMDGLSRFYWDPQNSGLEESIWDFDDFYFSKVLSEPDDKVATVSALYTGTRYEIAWNGPRNTSYTYDVRYKTTTMKVAGFTTGTLAGTMANPGDTYTGCLIQTGLMAESSVGMYMAIRVQGETNFTEVYIPYLMAPGNSGD